MRKIKTSNKLDTIIGTGKRGLLIRQVFYENRYKAFTTTSIAMEIDALLSRSKLTAMIKDLFDAGLIYKTKSIVQGGGPVYRVSPGTPARLIYQLIKLLLKK
jgi:predicted transcriptional regulator